jgi:cytochrome bd-type quinol oxidase subunit 2
MKILVVILLVAIFISLGSALFQIASRRGDSRKLTRAFALRVALSAALIIVLVLSWWFGWIE